MAASDDLAKMVAKCKRVQRQYDKCVAKHHDDQCGCDPTAPSKCAFPRLNLVQVRLKSRCICASVDHAPPDVPLHFVEPWLWLMWTAAPCSPQCQAKYLKLPHAVPLERCSRSILSQGSFEGRNNCDAEMDATLAAIRGRGA